MRRASSSSSRFRLFTYEHRLPPSAYSITRWTLLELSAFRSHAGSPVFNWRQAHTHIQNLTLWGSLIVISRCCISTVGGGGHLVTTILISTHMAFPKQRSGGM